MTFDVTNGKFTSLLRLTIKLKFLALTRLPSIAPHFANIPGICINQRHSQPSLACSNNYHPYYYQTVEIQKN